jgi:hypothetical protein
LNVISLKVDVVLDFQVLLCSVDIYGDVSHYYADNDKNSLDSPVHEAAVRNSDDRVEVGGP